MNEIQNQNLHQKKNLKRNHFGNPDDENFSNGQVFEHEPTI